jgi:hypothetical protein
MHSFYKLLSIESVQNNTNTEGLTAIVTNDNVYIKANMERAERRKL